MIAVDYLWRYRVKSREGPDWRVQVLDSNICGLHANSEKLDVAGSVCFGLYWIMMFCLKSLIAAISQSSISLALVAPNRG